MKPLLPTPIARDDIYLPADFPLTASSSVGVSPSFQRLHWHRALEINLIAQGSGTYVINGREYPFGQGDLFLIDSDDLHRAYEGQDLQMIIVMFDPALLAAGQRFDPELLLPFRNSDSGSSHHIVSSGGQSQVMIQYIENILKEYRAKMRSSRSVIIAQLMLFLAEVNRHFGTGFESADFMPPRQLEQMREVIRNMEQDLSRPWTLKELADLVHLSPSRFSTLFSQAAGSSPLNYLVQLRLSHAVQLLEEGSDPIVDIAISCGFRNLSNFNRLFRRHLGVSPREMRRRLHGNPA
ncbi:MULTISPECIES: AraC family transcriptional regulator [Paenibacillus]|uniref:AraC family transcriptional regulator n=1 Tax=Paenibacillus TaxID=44249 RepID=UPI0008380011|nr:MULTISPECIES: AraC family transcriptional regulator [Paenibacillus]GIP21182.1 AraC family transcriptional regulator [Paenibacillus sp. J22TS3]